MDFDALKNKAQDLISNVTGGSDAEPDQEKRDRGDQPSGVDQGYTDPGYQDQDQPGRMGQGGYQDTPGGFDQGGYRDQPGGLGQGGYQDTSGGFDQPGGYGGDPGVQGQGGYEDRSGALDQSGYPEQGRYGDAAGGGYDTGQGESGLQ